MLLQPSHTLGFTVISQESIEWISFIFSAEMYKPFSVLIALSLADVHWTVTSVITSLNPLHENM